MDLSFKDKTVIVTGAGRGIGAAVVDAFCAKGAAVMMASRTETELLEVQKSIMEKIPHAKLAYTVADISVESDIKKLFSNTSSEFGGINYLINNAATLIKGPIIDLSLDDWDKLMRVNVTGSFLCAREAFTYMQTVKEDTAIVNVSSLAGIKGVEKFPELVPYITSKHAIVGLTEGLAVEGRDYGIRVNAIAPGAVDTQMLASAFPDFSATTKPIDIVESFLFLCDEAKSRSITGTVLEIHCNN